VLDKADHTLNSSIVSYRIAFRQCRKDVTTMEWAELPYL